MLVDIAKLRSNLGALGLRSDSDLLNVLDELQELRREVSVWENSTKPDLENQVAEALAAKQVAEEKVAQMTTERDNALRVAVDAYRLPIVTAQLIALQFQHRELLDSVVPMQAESEVNATLAKVATRARDIAEAENARLQKQLATLRGRLAYLQAVQILAALPEDIAVINCLLTAVMTNFGYTSILDLFGHYGLTPPKVYGVHPMQRKGKGGVDRDPVPTQLNFAA